MNNIRLLAIALTVACATAQAEVSLVHVHGLAYSADGKRLMIPSHFGLAIYENFVRGVRGGSSP